MFNRNKIGKRRVDLRCRRCDYFLKHSSKFQIGEEVNLERAMRLSDRLGGIWFRDVNSIGTIIQLQKPGDNYYVEVMVPSEIKKYLERRFNAIDGISLTIARLEDDTSAFL
jgi:riboflavin synthase